MASLNYHPTIEDVNIVMEAIKVHGGSACLSSTPNTLYIIKDVNEKFIKGMIKLYIIHGKTIPRCYGKNFNRDCMPKIMEANGYGKIKGIDFIFSDKILEHMNG